VTPYALDRSFHIHLPEEAANSVTQRPNYGQSSYFDSTGDGSALPPILRVRREPNQQSRD